MNEYGWRGQGGPSQPDTGIAQALAYYARYGGEMLGARRSDNPLTLTHVRWHDQAGHVFDASHSPESDGEIDAAEREVWVQLALDLPIAAAGMYGAQAPWERLALNQDRATEMLNQLRRSLASRSSGNSNNAAYWSSGPATPQPPVNQGYPPNRSGANAGWNVGQPPAPAGTYPPPYQPMQPPMHPMQQPMQQPMQPMQPPAQPPVPAQSGYQQPANQPLPFQQSAPVGSMPGAPVAPGYVPHPVGESPTPGMAGTGGMPGMPGMPGAADSREWANAMRRSQEPEVTVIPCIEVELPPVLTDPAAADQARDFTRDVARHFNRSARQLQQVRETRGWMRNGRMVLAARIAVAAGSRVPSHMEMENAARLLGDALTRNMLPFTRMAFAEPGEWSQGIALPE